MPECELEEDGTYCPTHKCGAFEASCGQNGCPHCHSFFEFKYDDVKLTEVNRVVLSQLADGLIERDCA